MLMPNVMQQDRICIIFDCDGVLVDTEQLKFLSWQQALQERSITFSHAEYLPLAGHSSAYILQKIAALKNIPPDATICQRRHTIYHTLQCQSVPPITGAITFVQQLATSRNKHTIGLGLASSAPRQEIMINLQHIGLTDVFDVIVSGHDDLTAYNDPEGPNKPKPYIYQRAAQLLNVHPSQCVVFEDTNAGVTAAVSAGMTAIAVPNKYTQQHDFAQATRILSSLAMITLNDIITLQRRRISSGKPQR